MSSSCGPTGPSNLSAAITALALDDTGSLCAAGTGAGVVAIWALSNPTVGRPQRVLRGASSSVTSVHFVNTHDSRGSTPLSLARSNHIPTVFVTYENGTIVKWDGAKPDCPVLVSPPQGRRVLWSSVLHIPDTNRLVAAYSIEDGSLDIIELVPDFEPPLVSGCRLQAGNPTDTVASFHACLVELGGVRTLVIAAATEAGVISLWDGTTSFCIALLEEPRGALSALRLCPASYRRCTACGALRVDSFAVAITTGLTVRFFPIFLPPDITPSTGSSSRRCTCLHNKPPPPDAPPWGPSVRPHSRNSSSTFTTPVQPSRSRHTSVSENSTSFPIS